MMSELRNWCLSKLQRMETRLIADTRCAPLHRSSSLGGGVTLQGDSGAPPSASSFHLQLLPREPDEGQRGGGATGEEDMLDPHYFVVQMDSSSGSLLVSLIVTHLLLLYS